jgi:hypothetical protein
MSASIPPARRELTQLSATETNALPDTHGADPTVYLSRPRIAEEEEDEEEETWPPRMCISNLGRVELPQARARELEYLVPDDCVGDMVCRFDSPPDTSAVSPLRITNVRTDGEGNRYVLA